MSVKKALALVQETGKELDEHWYSISLDFLLSQLVKIETELKEEL